MSKKILVRAELVRKLPERWKAERLSRNGRWCSDRDHNTYEKLVKARDNDEPFTGIVHDSWTELKCDECGQNVESCASFDINYDEYTHCICPACLLAAAEEAQAALKTCEKPE